MNKRIYVKDEEMCELVFFGWMRRDWVLKKRRLERKKKKVIWKIKIVGVFLF